MQNRYVNPRTEIVTQIPSRSLSYVHIPIENRALILHCIEYKEKKDNKDILHFFPFPTKSIVWRLARTIPRLW